MFPRRPACSARRRSRRVISLPGVPEVPLDAAAAGGAAAGAEAGGIEAGGEVGAAATGRGAPAGSGAPRR
ncbi:hypothetical protein, partial [Myceligenerans cantabricum]